MPCTLFIFIPGQAQVSCAGWCCCCRSRRAPAPWVPTTSRRKAFLHNAGATGTAAGSPAQYPTRGRKTARPSLVEGVRRSGAGRPPGQGDTGQPGTAWRYPALRPGSYAAPDGLQRLPAGSDAGRCRARNRALHGMDNRLLEATEPQPGALEPSATRSRCTRQASTPRGGRTSGGGSDVR